MLAIIAALPAMSSVMVTADSSTSSFTTTKEASVNNKLIDISPAPGVQNYVFVSQSSIEGTPVTTIFTTDGFWYQIRSSLPTPGISYRKYSDKWYTISTKTADTIITKAIGGLAGSFGGVIGSLAASELMPSSLFKTGYTYEHVILSYARDSVNTYIKMEGWAYKDKAHKHLVYHNTSYQKVPRK